MRRAISGSRFRFPWSLSRRVRDDVDAPVRGDSFDEQALDVELVGEVGANGERGGVRGEDLFDCKLGLALIA
jgi:hypothetical protein